jgi:Ribosomal protein L7/L12 C-terminal domain
VVIKIYCPKCGCYCPDALVPATHGQYRNVHCLECKTDFKIELQEPLTLTWLIVSVKVDNAIHTIKRVREVTGWGLKESKNLVDLVSAITKGKDYHLDIPYKPEVNR